MSNVKGKNTSIELLVRKYLYSHGVRYRVHSKRILGSPDISIKKYRIAIFINGCFWHGHGCKKSSLPKSNQLFWKNKIEANIARDARVIAELKKQGWNIYVVWECELLNYMDTSLNLLKEWIEKSIRA